MSVKSGIAKAFLAYFADSGVMLRDNAYPLVGKNSLISQFANSRTPRLSFHGNLFMQESQKVEILGIRTDIMPRTIKSTGVVSKGTY